MKLAVQFATVFSVTTLVGCDVGHGVTRMSRPFQPYPGTLCVANAAGSIEGVSELSHSEEQGGRPITLSGIKAPDRIYRFRYKYDNVENDFYFRVRYDGETELRHVYGCIGCTPPQDVIDTIYPYFLALERALEDQCDISDLAGNIQEHCSGVKCPSENGI